MVIGPKMSRSRARTMKVYGRSSAILTIHMNLSGKLGTGDAVGLETASEIVRPDLAPKLSIMHRL
jgi:hypothetical protein